MLNLKLSTILLYGVCFILFACGGGNTNGSNTGLNVDNESSSGLPSDINGLLVYGWMKSVRYAGSYSTRVSNGNVIESKSIITKQDGEVVYAHKGGDIVYLQSCGYVDTRAVMVKKNGFVTDPITPCTKDVVIKHIGAFDRKLSFFDTAKLSPDKTKVVTNGTYYASDDGGYDGNGSYSIVIVYDAVSREELKRYQHYTSPAWHPDGSLLLQATGYGLLNTDFGLYLTDKVFSSLSRIGEINRAILDPNISPTGKQVAFSMGGQLWVIDINGKNLHEIVSGKAELRFPTWSPNEKYIAYLSYADTYDTFNKITFYSLASENEFILNTDTVLPSNSSGRHTTISPTGPLSWIK